MPDLLGIVTSQQLHPRTHRATNRARRVPARRARGPALKGRRDRDVMVWSAITFIVAGTLYGPKLVSYSKVGHAHPPTSPGQLQLACRLSPRIVSIPRSLIAEVHFPVTIIRLSILSEK